MERADEYAKTQASAFAEGRRGFAFGGFVDPFAFLWRARVRRKKGEKRNRLCNEAVTAARYA